MPLLATGVDPHPLCDASFFFHQLLAGVDVAVPSRASTPSQRRVFDMAKQMQNYMYLVGDAQTRECVAVDAVSHGPIQSRTVLRQTWCAGWDMTGPSLTVVR